MAKKAKKRRKGACYCTVSRDSKGVILGMFCSRSKKRTRRAASREGRRRGERYGKVFRAVSSNC